MMTVEDIHNVTFDRSMRGYRPEDVDTFLTKVAQEFDALTQERDAAIADKEASLAAAQQEKEETEKKLYVLADKIEQYRQDEENLKTALLNAQRLGETVVHEAKQKAETLVYDAKSKANQIQETAKENVAAEEKKLSAIQAEVSRFKGTILTLYKQHIEALSALPVAEEKERGAAAPAILFSEEELKEKPQPVRTAEPVPASEPAPKGRRKAKEAEPSEVEQESFLFEEKKPSGSAVESFENYQGIRFDE